MQADAITATILMLDHYRYVRYHYVVRLVAIFVGLLVLSLLGNFILLSERAKFRYVMTEATGRIMRLVPLTEPNMDDEAVKKWAVDSVTRLYTFDFANYRRQFQDAQKILTGIGWDGFQAGLQKSGTFTAVTENRFVTTAVPRGPAQIKKKDLFTGADGSQRYGWLIEVPMLITYRSSKSSTSQDLVAQAWVVRMPEWINPQGLGIRQVLSQ